MVRTSALFVPAIFTAAAVGCGGVVRSGDPAAGGASSTAPDREVAHIVVSASTNASEIDVVVYSDGSAERTLGPAKYGTSLDQPPASFPLGSAEGESFLKDLAKVGDVSLIPTQKCAKSVSFGTTTTVTSNGKTSGDLQCLLNPTAASQSLVRDVEALTTENP
jgi:hypothetical protein